MWQRFWTLVLQHNRHSDFFLFQFAEDYTIEADLPSNANKAAKFFETKKAEAKAATAIAKHEASKDGKKVSAVQLCLSLYC